MRKKPFPNLPLFLFLFLFVTLVTFWAASAEAFEQIILKNQTEPYSLGPNLVYIEDHQAKWSIENIRNPALTKQWQPNKKEVPAFGFTSSAFWFAVELKNANTSSIKQLLTLSYPLLDSVDIYLDRSGKIVDQFHTGDHEIFAQRPIEHRYFLFPIHMLESDQITLYIRVHTSGALQIPLTLWSERNFWKADQLSSIVQGGYFGIMLVMILYNLFIYTTVHDRSYLYYVFFVSCFTVMQFTQHGFAFRYFWPQHPWFNEKILIISGCATITFAGFFAISFLELKKHDNKLFRILLLATLITLITNIASLGFNYSTAMGIALITALIMSFFCLTAGYIMLRRDYTPARYYTFAWVGFIFGTIAFVLSKFGVIPRTLLTENGIQLGSTIEVLLLSFALANRINIISKEKELAQAETVSILKKYQALYENAIEGIFQITLESKFVSANRATIKMLGLPDKETLFSSEGDSLCDYFANQAKADKFCQILFDTGEIIGHEFKVQRADGGEFWASISTRTIYDENNNPIHYEGSLVDITEKRKAEEQVRYMAYYDNVTGLPNRVFLQDLLKHALDRAKRNNEQVAVLFVDLNRFKLVNDTLGHNAGDRLLKEVAERLHQCLRGGDWVGRPQASPVDVDLGGATRNTVARLGGDEFVMVLTDIGQPKDAATVAQRIGKTLAQSFTVDDREIYVSASIGISIYPIDSDNSTTLLKQADIAMYYIKKQGSNSYQFYADSLSVNTSTRLTLETELRNALSNNEFQLYYQPKLDLESGQIIGAEALCRWLHPKHGMILPGDFIDLAEETGLIIPLGELVLRSACEQNKSWQDAGIPPIRVSVNLSARQFVKPDLSQSILLALENSGLDPCYLELELTETILMDNIQASLKVLDQLKKVGLHISVDDFGTGYSSLSYLKRLPVDTLKIDSCFIQDIPQDTDNQAITAAIISMAKQLGLKVVAEGVETEAQLHYLQEHLCDEIQGYLVSAALAVEPFSQFLLNRHEEKGL